MSKEIKQEPHAEELAPFDCVVLKFPLWFSALCCLDNCLIIHTKPFWENFCGPARSKNCKWKVGLRMKFLAYELFSYEGFLYKNIPSSWTF